VRDLVSSLNTYIEKYPPVIFQHRYFQHGSMGGKIGEQPTVVNALSCSVPAPNLWVQNSNAARRKT